MWLLSFVCGPPLPHRLQVWEMFDPAPVAIPCAIVAIVYMTAVASFLLPKATGPADPLAPKDGVPPRLFYSTYTVVPGGAAVGHTVAAGGVKQARDMVLLAVVRTEALHTPEDELVLEAKDT